MWDTAAHFARELAVRLHENGLPDGTLLNVNVPNVPLDQVQGYAVTRMGQSRYVEVFDKRSDPRGNIYYWMDGEIELLGDREDTDIEALKKNMVSLTPIDLDRTDHDAMDQLKGWNITL